jgi:hypothetical protein
MRKKSQGGTMVEQLENWNMGNGSHFPWQGDWRERGAARTCPLGSHVNSTPIPLWFNVISLKWRGNKVDSTSG